MKEHLPRLSIYMILCLLSLLVALPVLAQTGGIFDLTWSTIDGGGGAASTGGGFSLGGTIGQPDAGVMAGGDYTLAGGFWGGGGIQENRPPTDIQLSNNTIMEGQPSGSLVGTLITSDPDVGDTFTYALVNGDGDTDNGSFNISGVQLLTAEEFDYQVKSSYTVRISTTDSGGLDYEKPFTITVLEFVEEGNVIFLPLVMK
jgi:hypothetical protein